MGGFGSGTGGRRGPAKELFEPVWGRQPFETQKAFEAFLVYLELRGIHLVAERLSKSYALIKRWCSRWRWYDRVRAHDNETMRIEMETMAVERVKARKDNLQIARGLKAVGAAELKKLADLVKASNTRQLTAKETKDMLDLAVRLERLHLGDAETVVEERTNISFADLARELETLEND